MTSLFLALLVLAAPAKSPGKEKVRAPVDHDPPQLSHLPLGQAAQGRDLRIEAMITDASGVFAPTLSWRVAGGSWKKVPLVPSPDGMSYAATVPGAEITGDVEYFLEAFDKANNGPSSAGSAASPFVARVPAAAAPPPPPSMDLSGPVDLGGSSMGAGPSTVPQWATIGAGAVVAVLGGVLWMVASGDARDLRAQYTRGGAFKPADGEKAASAAFLGRVGSGLVFAGVLTGGGGAIWLAAGSSSSGTVVGMRLAF